MVPYPPTQHTQKRKTAAIVTAEPPCSGYPGPGPHGPLTIVAEQKKKKCPSQVCIALAILRNSLFGKNRIRIAQYGGAPTCFCAEKSVFARYRNAGTAIKPTGTAWAVFTAPRAPQFKKKRRPQAPANCAIEEFKLRNKPLF